MVSMKRSKADKADQNPAPMETIGPDYPWGLCLNLSHDELTKLGITEMPKVGTTMVIECKVMVTRVEQSASAGRAGKTDEHRCLGLQVTDIDMGE